MDNFKIGSNLTRIANAGKKGVTKKAGSSGSHGLNTGLSLLKGKVIGRRPRHHRLFVNPESGKDEWAPFNATLQLNPGTNKLQYAEPGKF